MPTFAGHEPRRTAPTPNPNFRLLSFFVVLYSKTKAKSPKTNKAIAGEAFVGSGVRSRHYRRRSEWLRHRARCCGPRKLCFSVRNEGLGERDVVLVDQARAWRPALSRILRVSPGPRGADRARNPLGNRAPYHPPPAFRFAAPCRPAPGLAAPTRPVPLRPYRRAESLAADPLGRFVDRRGRPSAGAQPLQQSLRIFRLLRRRRTSRRAHRAR